MLNRVFILLCVLLCIVGIGSATANHTVYNGDFETGTLAGWDTYVSNPSHGFAIASTFSKYEGNYGADLGYVSIGEYGKVNITQTVNLTHRDTLEYYYKIQILTGAQANASVYVNGDLKTQYTSPTSSWAKETIDIYGYTGDVVIEFRIETDSAKDIQMLIDNVQVVGPPILYTPTNESIVSGTFPPLAHDVDFTWEDIDNSYDSYRYQIARDAAFNIIVSEQYTTNNYTTIALPDDDYWWRVANYNSTSEADGNWSDVFNFDVDLTAVGISGTNIDGIVYEVTDSGDVPVTESIVYIYNTTWSSQQITGANGYYQFTGLANDTYSIQATKQGFVDSNIELVTTVYDDTVTKNILIERRSGAGDQYNFHYVKFVVKNIFDTRYEDVTASVYEGNDLVSIYSGDTGSDGAVSFILNEDQEYRITFIDAIRGIDEELVLYPKEDYYNVYVIITTLAPDEQYSSEEIDTSVSKQLINNTHAYINVTYLDNLNETTGLDVYLNQSITNDPFNQTVIDSYSGASNSTIISFIVEDYAGETYFVNIDIEHITFDEVQRTYAVTFDGMEDDHGFSQVYIWLAIGGIMFSGMIFKATNARQGAFIVCVVAWVFIILGWFDNLGLKGVLAITAGVTLATILSIAAIMAKGEKEG